MHYAPSERQSPPSCGTPIHHKLLPTLQDKHLDTRCCIPSRRGLYLTTTGPLLVSSSAFDNS